MQVSFYKIQAYASDYILISTMGQSLPAQQRRGDLAREMLRRRTGVGGKGLILLSPAEGAKNTLSYFTPRGKEEHPPPDALLCACRYCFDSGFVENETITFSVTGEDTRIRVIDSSHFRFSLGQVKEFYGNIPIVEEPEGEYNRTILTGGKSLVVTPLFLWEPYYVHFSSKPKKNRKYYAQAIRETREDQNTTPPPYPLFASVYAPDEIYLPLAFSRNRPNAVSACGAALAAAVLNGFAEREAVCYCNSSKIYIEWVQLNNEIYITGEAAYSFTGEYYLSNGEN